MALAGMDWERVNVDVGVVRGRLDRDLVTPCNDCLVELKL